ncbi:Dihydroflavonol-4-reductase [Quillaja saponaria]|uniref:Dihydroflavonol-4-reductase n=1 Tax=Quillaja saponaria TaxID=32244 RepID=A0AAD7LQF5_QUISA|nr:Dihydroflavonol-4-reductase [Quillaja saponaria]
MDISIDTRDDSPGTSVTKFSRDFSYKCFGRGASQTCGAQIYVSHYCIIYVDSSFLHGHLRYSHLRACLNSKTVKRVVYTSSIAAVASSGNIDGQVVDESFWSNVDFLRARKRFRDTYAISKTLTEKAALEFAEQNGIDVVTILPSFVVGPFICPQLASSVYAVLAMAFGNKDLFWFPLHAVHVEDLARAYLFLFEHSNPKGRYICSSEYVTIERTYEFLSNKYPEFEVPAIDFLKEGREKYDLSSKKLLDA